MKRLLPLAFLLTSCTYSIHGVHVSDFEGVAPAQGKMIEAMADQFVFFHFSFDTDYVAKAYEKLMAECKDGNIHGITTQYSTRHGFFSWKNKVLMKGLCVL